MDPHSEPQSNGATRPCILGESPLNSWRNQLLQMSADTEPAQPLSRTVSGAEERLRLALAGGRMGIWELPVDQQGTLVLSPELQTILGFEAGQFDGSLRLFINRVDPQDRIGVLKAISKAIKYQADPELEFRFIRSGNSPGWLLGRGRLYRNERGRPIRFVGVGIDVTAQKIAELEILRLNAELERRVAERTAQLQATNRELEAFCYSVSHDLRAPLRSIRGFNEVLLERYSSKLDARGQEFLRRACESSHYMDDLIDDLLKLSRVSRSELLHQNVDLSVLVKVIADELKSAEPARSVEFRIADSLRAHGDERLLRIVLENLLRNAWKFTSKRPNATIEFGSISTPDPTFFVRDNGAGFDPAFTNRLFGVFQRLHSSSEFAGTGVGLATVQRIVNRHGGRVWGDGSVDHGATFYFSLPAHETN